MNKETYWLVRWLVITWGVLMVNFYAQIVGMYFHTLDGQLISMLAGGLGGGLGAWWFFWTWRHGQQ